MDARVVAHLVEHGPHAGVQASRGGRGHEGPPVVERRALPVERAQRASPHGPARDQPAPAVRVEPDVVGLVQAVHGADAVEVGQDRVQPQVGDELPEPLGPLLEAEHVARVLAQEVALDQREAALDQLEEVPGVERVEGVELGDEGVEVEAGVGEVAADADLVLVDHQHLVALRGDVVQAPPEAGVVEHGTPEDQEVRRQVQVPHVGPLPVAQEAGLGLGERDRRVVDDVRLVVLHRGGLQAPPVAGAGVHLREDVVERSQQVAGVVGQDHLVVAVEAVPADEVAGQQRERAEVVGAVRDAPRVRRRSRRAGPAGRARAPRRPRRRRRRGGPARSGSPRRSRRPARRRRSRRRGRPAGPAVPVRTSWGCGWAPGGAAARAPRADRRAGSGAAGRPPRRWGRGAWPSSARGRSAGSGRAGCASRSRRSGAPGPGGAAAGAGRRTRRRRGSRWRPPPRGARRPAPRAGAAAGRRRRSAAAPRPGPCRRARTPPAAPTGGRAPLAGEAPPAALEVGDGLAALLELGHRGRGG